MAKKLHQMNLWESSGLVATGAALGQTEKQKGKASREQLDAERMARGRGLAADPNYPPDEILEALSEMLARHWYS